ncbi:TIGR03086 family metal-binding protein [Modestobacter sp. I12A-02662]|uniref:TIGR03086 family metal-binding protein n=1 Tax=Modestobacter sp. I12A-02662 TaxID=1730496 RepID=UPI0034E037B7
MTETSSLPPAVRAAAELAASALTAVRAEQLTTPTPCGDFDVRALVDHLAWGALLSQRAATRLALEHDWSSNRPAPFLDGLDPAEWPAAIIPELDAAADAWADPAAWEGETLMGTTPMPAEVVGPLMLAEFVLHGWDLARAVGAPYDVPAEVGEATLAAVRPVAEMGRDGGWYGPEVAVPVDAPAFERALGLSGRDPAWAATAGRGAARG